MPKLMLVEDDNNLREIYEARLQAEGYQIVSAKDGEEALVLAKAEKPDLIISDVMMPKISGFEMLDILRNTEGLKQVKVIMLTALGQNDDQKLANRLGTDRYLVKSQVTLEDIVKVTHELLGDDQAAAPGTETPAPPADPAASPAPSPNPAPVDNAATPTPPPTPPAADTTAPAPPAEPSVPATPPVPEPAPQPVPPPTSPPAEPSTPDPTPAAPPTVLPPQAPSSTPALTATVPADPAPATDTAQSTVQEEASVDGKIEDFVAGASEEPTPVTPPAVSDETTLPEPSINPVVPTPPEAAQPSPEPALSVPAAPTPTPATPAAETAETNTANDDKLVTEAAQKLVDSTEAAAAPAADTKDNATETVSPKPANATSADEDRRTKKIIKPIDTGPKKDLDTLLALEEAKEASTAPAPAAIPIVVSDSGEHPASPPENPVIEPTVDEDTPSGDAASSAKPVVTTAADPADPNNIAL